MQILIRMTRPWHCLLDPAGNTRVDYPLHWQGAVDIETAAAAILDGAAEPARPLAPDHHVVIEAHRQRRMSASSEAERERQASREAAAAMKAEAAAILATPDDELADAIPHLLAAPPVVPASVVPPDAPSTPAPAPRSPRAPRAPRAR